MTAETSHWVRRAADQALGLHRTRIGRRLRWCFVLIILLMSAGHALLLWQFHVVHVQAKRLKGVDQELIAVLRFQTALRSFHSQLNELALSQNTSRLTSGFQKIV